MAAHGEAQDSVFLLCSYIFRRYIVAPPPLPPRAARAKCMSPGKKINSPVLLVRKTCSETMQWRGQTCRERSTPYQAYLLPAHLLHLLIAYLSYEQRCHGMIGDRSYRARQGLFWRGYTSFSVGGGQSRVQTAVIVYYLACERSQLLYMYIRQRKTFYKYLY